MKKLFSRKIKKWFTLIEMLIVIVIIGILAAALIPRLASARGRANDVARKADLQQLANALVAYQMDHGFFPATAQAISGLNSELINAWMSSLPTDPNATRSFSGIAALTIWWWQFGYTPITKWAIAANGFVLMAGTETEWWSNWVVGWSVWNITTTTDFASIIPCKTFTVGTPTSNTSGACVYSKTNDELRYIVVY